MEELKIVPPTTIEQMVQALIDGAEQAYLGDPVRCISDPDLVVTSVVAQVREHTIEVLRPAVDVIGPSLVYAALKMAVRCTDVTLSAEELRKVTLREASRWKSVCGKVRATFGK
jgi:hypothetical protein